MFSSDSNFTLALTPAGLTQDSSTTLVADMPPLIEQIGDKQLLTHFENGGNDEFHSFSEVFQPLNIFKLNEYRARVDQVCVFCYFANFCFSVAIITGKSDKIK